MELRTFSKWLQIIDVTGKLNDERKRARRKWNRKEKFFPNERGRSKALCCSLNRRSSDENLLSSLFVRPPSLIPLLLLFPRRCYEDDGPVSFHLLVRRFSLLLLKRLSLLLITATFRFNCSQSFEMKPTATKRALLFPPFAYFTMTNLSWDYFPYGFFICVGSNERRGI